MFKANSIFSMNIARWLVLFLAWFIAKGTVLHAQESSRHERLIGALEDARLELASERERIRLEDESQEKELKEITAQLHNLSGEIVDRSLSIAQKKPVMDALRTDRDQLRQRQARFQKDRTEIHLIGADARQKLSDLLEILPPSELRNRQERLFLEFESALKTSEQPLDYMYPLIDVLGLLLEESHSTAIFNETIRNADGYEEAVEILRLGQILFAYRSQNSSRVAFAVAGPEGEKSYRWNENLPKWARDNIIEAINKAQSGGGVCYLPVDVTQKLASQRHYGQEAFLETLSAGGLVMIPLGVVAFLAVILILERFVFLIRQGRGGEELAEAVLTACHAGEFRKAEQILDETGGLISRVLRACLSQRKRGAAVMSDAVQEKILHELPQLERFMSTIALLAGVAPLLGLLGTVTGMISTFETIAIFGSGEPRLMAGGISEALITTATGLVIAIPILFVHSYLSDRTENLMADMERFSATLLNLLNEESPAEDRPDDKTQSEKS